MATHVCTMYEIQGLQSLTHERPSEGLLHVPTLKPKSFSKINTESSNLQFSLFAYTIHCIACSISIASYGVHAPFMSMVLFFDNYEQIIFTLIALFFYFKLQINIF